MSDGKEVVVIMLPGPRIRDEVTESVRSEISSHLDGGRVHLLLDAAQVEFVDSSFLGMLVSVLKRATASGGDIKLCCLQKSVSSVFQLMRLHRVFELYDSRETALEAFK